jgi:hypothetical protein
MTFYNTIGETGDELSKSIAQAKSQEAKIMKCFKYYEGRYPRLRFSPSMVLNMTKLRCPITSIRRAMTNLSNEGKLVKTDKKVKGLYGKQEHLWSLPKEPEIFKQNNLPF